MTPVRFFTDQQTVWYNLSDYIQLLLETGLIRPFRSAPLYKRKIPPKAIHDILLPLINRLNPVYQWQQDGMLYVDWVVFEHLYRFVRPFLVRPDDWSDNSRLFRQLQLFIEQYKRLPQGNYPEAMVEYFTELPKITSVDQPIK